MNDQTSIDLRAQYPLHKRKFWKKVLPKLFAYSIYCIGIFVFSINLQVVEAVYDPSSMGTLIYPLAILVAGIPLILYMIYLHYYIAWYYYHANDSFITIKKGVFMPAEIHVQYLKIQDVNVDQDLLDRILGIYDVHLASATFQSGIEAHIDGVGQEQAEALKEFLLGRITEKERMGESSQSTQKTGIPVVTNSINTSFLSTANISSATYPIEEKWMTMWIVIACVIAAISVLNIFLPIPVLIGIIAFAKVYKKNYRFEFRPEFIFLHTSVITTKEKHLPYSAVQDVTVQQGLIDRIFGLANVVILNAATTAVQTKRGTRFISDSIVIPGQLPAKAQELAEILKKILVNIPNRQNGL